MISVVIPHYNSSELLAETIGKLQNRSIRERVKIEIVVVDDASSEPHRSRARELGGGNVRIVLSNRNLGRSGAVNLGVAEARNNLALILDCDCHPGSERFFGGHLDAIAEADVSLGGLLKLNDDFWGRYQDLADNRRVRQFRKGMPFSFTTQNMLIRKSVLESVGGYDESYRHYGFEDRDLLARLNEAGARFAHAATSAVIHCDPSISLASVTKKMREAGRHTAIVFSSRHPAAYRALGYSRFDAHQHPLLIPLGRLAGKITQRLSSKIDPLLNVLPFPLGVALARVITAMAYLAGTAEAASARSSA